MKTHSVKAGDIRRNWIVIDATGQILGRLATQAAVLLMGKHKPTFSRHLDTGDFVVVVNAAKIRVTGRKPEQKRYYRHSGYPGGLRSETLAQILAQRPAEAVRRAVRGMLPRNKLGEAMASKLKVYDGPEHPHQAQRPEEIAK